jgi:hypothetical protein
LGGNFTAEDAELVKNSKSEALSTKQIQNSNYQMVKINGGLRSGEERKIKG